MSKTFLGGFFYKIKFSLAVKYLMSNIQGGVGWGGWLATGNNYSKQVTSFTNTLIQVQVGIYTQDTIFILYLHRKI